jgi:FlaA1/EpsC-like NDP-sugar epimerase
MLGIQSRRPDNNQGQVRRISWLKTKRILVTGGAGFLGKHMFKKLEERGCKEIFVPHVSLFSLDLYVYERLIPSYVNWGINLTLGEEQLEYA